MWPPLIGIRRLPPPPFSTLLFPFTWNAETAKEEEEKVEEERKEKGSSLPRPPILCLAKEEAEAEEGRGLLLLLLLLLLLVPEKPSSSSCPTNGVEGRKPPFPLPSFFGQRRAPSFLPSSLFLLRAWLSGAVYGGRRRWDRSKEEDEEEEEPLFPAPRPSLPPPCVFAHINTHTSAAEKALAVARIERGKCVCAQKMFLPPHIRYY